MKGKFSVIADKDIGVAGWRRWIWFNIDYSVNPSLVIAAAERAVADAEIANVAHDPKPSCVAMEFAPGSVRYALRYWLVDPRDDDPTDSAVRTHLLATIQRNGWRIALPDQAVHLRAGRRCIARSGVAARADAAPPGAVRHRTVRDARRERAPQDGRAPGACAVRQGRHHYAPGRRGALALHHRQRRGRRLWEAPGGERRLLAHLPKGSIFGEMG